MLVNINHVCILHFMQNDVNNIKYFRYLQTMDATSMSAGTAGRKSVKKIDFLKNLLKCKNFQQRHTHPPIIIEAKSNSLTSLTYLPFIVTVL